MKRKILLVCILSFILNVPVYASDLSDWALADYENLSKGGILTYDVVAGNLKAPITRREVCGLLINMYEQLTITGIPQKENVFEDTDDENVYKAYSAGIVSGKSETVFDPEGAVTRQEFAKMILNTLTSAGVTFDTGEDVINETLAEFDDAGDVADWARGAMAVTIKTKIINGVSENIIDPNGSATREQAICMLSRVYNQFVKEKTLYDSPEMISNLAGSNGDMKFTWSGIDGAKKYMVLIKDPAAQIMEAFETVSENAVVYTDDYITGFYTLTLGAENPDGVQTYSKPVDISVTEPVPMIPAVSMSYAEKESIVFPSGRPFANAEEAEQYMVTVTVPVWKLDSNGQKYSSKASLTVNYGVADDVVSIFTEIYNSPEQFPIKSVGGYNWRSTASGSLSQHSYGTCIDINPDENYYVRPDGTPITGSFWKPYENPYSIPEDGSVVEIFNRYGWGWGGNCWSDSNPKDYMHFTFLGR